MPQSDRDVSASPLYRVEPLDLAAHLYRVTLTIPSPSPRQRLSLPVWIPGSYLVREFARQVERLDASQAGRERPAHKVDKTTWVVQCQGGAALEVRIEVYAFDASVRAAYLDDQRGFFNGTGLLLRVEGREQQPHRLQIAGLPAGWQVATALAPVRVRASGEGLYEAADYDELVDHPVELGRFWRGHFEACGVPHEFVVAGAPDAFDGERLIADARRICETQIRFWHGRGRPPFKRYVFLLNAVQDGYGGLEHRASTALICRRADLPVHRAAGARPEADAAPDDGYVTLLGLISHEYFHTWNVKRLRPADFAAIDYGRENHTTLLWFFEGFTSYYDDLFLRRAGLIDDARYLRLLSKTLHAVEQTPGRHVQSVAEASFDAWTKYYRADENTPNLTVSYYTAGARLALALDLTLRVSGQSLDDVMRTLWRRASGGPVSLVDIMAAVREVGGDAPARKLGAWVHTRGDPALLPLLRRFGLEVLREPATVAQSLGLRLQEQDGRVIVKSVWRGGAGHAAGLSAGDEWLGVNDWRIARAADLNAHAPEGDAKLLVAREQRLKTLTVPADAPRAPGAPRLQVAARGAPAADVLREAWLRSTPGPRRPRAG